jgi:hypothetical protein
MVGASFGFGVGSPPFSDCVSAAGVANATMIRALNADRNRRLIIE